MNGKASDEADAVTFQGNAGQRLQVEFYHALVLLVRAWRVGGNIGCRIARFDEFVLDEITFDFFAADVGKHLAVDYDTRRKRLPTLGFHFPAERRVLNNILLGVGQVVFGQNSANASAPAQYVFKYAVTSGFCIGGIYHKLFEL